MLINFKNVTIENFQSIKKAEVELSNQGIVGIKGVNLYEKKGASNGSGKSSIAESICYALFGKTSYGIASCHNKYVTDECKVTLDFDIDSQSYRIVRGEKGKTYKQYVELYKGEEDISARNKTDTDKVIEELLPFSREIYLSTVFLSQNFSGKLSALTPSGRKDRIEQITNIAEKIEELKSSLTAKKNNYTDSLNKKKTEVSYAEGRLSFLNTQIARKGMSIEDVEKQIEQMQSEEDIDTVVIKAKIDQYTNMLKELETLKNDRNERLAKTNMCIAKENGDLSTLRYKVKNLTKELSDLKEGKTCPTCGTRLVGSASAEVINEKNNSLRDATVRLNNSEKIYDELTKDKDGVASELNVITTKETKIKSLLDKTNTMLIYATEKNNKITAAQEQIEGFKKEIEEFNNNILEENEARNIAMQEQNTFESKAEIATHSLSILTKQFRNYMLSETINYINELLAEYSAYVFEKDIISLVSDGGKLDIYLGEQLYETLSGGEKKKVDIALVLAQRDLCMNISGSESNILILDEILENIDQDGSTATLDLILEKCNSESTFIVSHNNYSLPYDKCLTVVKEIDRCSHIEK